MAPRNIMTSAPQLSRRRFAAPLSPGGQSDLIPDQDDILAELGLQVDDSASSVGGSTTGISTIDSGISVDGSASGGGRRRRRRRNRNRNNQGGENNAIDINNNSSNENGNFNKQATVTIPRHGGGDRDERPVKLKLGLDLDVDLELKAKLKGDICISLVAERKTFSKRGSLRVKPNWRGEVDVEEIFHMRIGRFRFRQRWIEREVSESLTVAVAFCIAAAGFVAGLAASRLLG
ncbi:hypothetical protein LZ31DRAFT_599096 [Colletotrichum somersetense]|nr:hypothetical protein LZ31DRAFT_599096 [Colletotrichum somersetense]